MVEQRTKCRKDLDELQRDREMFQNKLKQTRVEVDSALELFATEQSAKVAEHKSLEEADMRRLEEVRRQRNLALQSEVQLNRQQLAKAVEGMQQREEAQLKDIRQDFRARYQVLQSRCLRIVEHERKATSDLAERKGKWEKQAERLRRSVGMVLSPKRILNQQAPMTAGTCMPA